MLSSGTSGASTGTTTGSTGYSNDSGVQSQDQLQALAANPGSGSGAQSHTGSGAS